MSRSTTAEGSLNPRFWSAIPPGQSCGPNQCSTVKPPDCHRGPNGSGNVNKLRRGFVLDSPLPTVMALGLGWGEQGATTWYKYPEVMCGSRQPWNPQRPARIYLQSCGEDQQGTRPTRQRYALGASQRTAGPGRQSLCMVKGWRVRGWSGPRERNGTRPRTGEF
jgi:hypothetical protein